MTTKRTMQAIVERATRHKTAIVKVSTEKRHPQYHKKYSVTKRYKVHDEKGTAAVGDKVTIEETRPLSRDKHWRIV